MPDRSDRPLEPTAARGVLAPAGSHVDGGRLGVYAAIGATVGAVPLPWVPSVLARRVRGALVHDIASRHGRTLSPSAREVLADASDPVSNHTSGHAKVSRALRYASKRLALRALRAVPGISPLRALFPVAQGLQIYALGHLFDRYLSGHAVDPSVSSARIERPEALRVRVAIDGAMARVLDASPADAEEPAAADDERDRVTALVDGLLGAAAGLPARMTRGLDAAFDALLSSSP